MGSQGSTSSCQTIEVVEIYSIMVNKGLSESIILYCHEYYATLIQLQLSNLPQITSKP